MKHERFQKTPGPKDQSDSMTLEPPIIEIEKVGNELQARLALLAAHDRHPDLAIDVTHPETNGSEIRKLAMGEWVTGDDAADFRDYVEDPLHAGELLDPASATELRKLLSSIRNKGTLH